MNVSFAITYYFSTDSWWKVTINLVKKETFRLFGVLEIHLSGKFTGEPREYLAGSGKGKYSVADIGTWRKFPCLDRALS